MSNKQVFIQIARIMTILILLLGFLAAPVPMKAAANRTDIVGPEGSSFFGETVTVLTNGNFVVTDAWYSPGGSPAEIGAAFLYDGDTYELISTLTGSQEGDHVGYGGVTALPNGNYVVIGSDWQNGVVPAAGAVTWCSGITGCDGEVSADNSLVGSQAGDLVGSSGIVTLSDGDYVVVNPMWINGAIDAAGAVTWCSGVSGCQGPVSASNSLVGSKTGEIEQNRKYIKGLSNGNYVVRSPSWDNGLATSAGAVTWCNGNGGCSGPITAANSLVGTQTDDQVGYGFYDIETIYEVANSNYVVTSYAWYNGSIYSAGAVTWCNGATGCQGPVTPTNSLVGSHFGDELAISGLVVLTNGNYVVPASDWMNGTLDDVGAVTWCSGNSGCHGVVSDATSLVGTHLDDSIGQAIPLSNGNYVVRSSLWNSDTTPDVGSLTFCSGTSGCVGPVTASNSLVGTHTQDFWYSRAFALPNGNYVHVGAYWDNGTTVDTGAVTLCSGTTGCKGTISASNSLVGSQAQDLIGTGPTGLTRLANGNYVINSPYWDSGAVVNAGAVTWCSATSGCKGTVNTINSLVGTNEVNGLGSSIALANGNYLISATAASDPALILCSGTGTCTGSAPDANYWMSSGSVVPLVNGNFLMANSSWDNGSIISAGAVTWCSGTIGCTSPVSPLNSLVGSHDYDLVGEGPEGVPVALSDASYVVNSMAWDNGTVENVGAVTWGDGSGGSTVGPITEENSVLGETASAGDWIHFVHDPSHFRLFISRPRDNTVTVLWKTIKRIYLPLLRR